MYDVIIIGAGVTGSAVARELSRYKLNVCVLDKEEDVCCGTSKANSAIVHAGFDAATGSLMARFNVRGNEMMDQLSKDLDIPFKRNGALVVCIHESEKDGLKDLYDRGVANGVKGLQILSREEALEKEPNLSENVVAALYAPTSGIVCPFILNIAMAENACVNGVDFFFNTEVESLTPGTCKKHGNPIWTIRTNNGVYKARYVVNAAGVYADKFHNMVSEKKINITPRRGDYCLLDKTVGNHVSHTIFPQPTKLGKGVLVSPTVHGNLIVGPTAVDIENKEGNNTTAAGINDLIEKAGDHVRNLPIRQVITSFAGLRAHEDHHEFIVREVEDAPHFIDCAGIESPGLTSCPAIGEYVGAMLKEKMGWVSRRRKTGSAPARGSSIPPTSPSKSATSSSKKSPPTAALSAAVSLSRRARSLTPSTGPWAPVPSTVSSAGPAPAWVDARQVSARPARWRSSTENSGSRWRRSRNLAEIPKWCLRGRKEVRSNGYAFL